MAVKKTLQWLAEAPERFRRYALGITRVYLPDDTITDIKNVARTHHRLSIDLNDHLDRRGDVERASSKLVARLYYTLAMSFGLFCLGGADNEHYKLVQKLVNDQSILRTFGYMLLSLQCIDMIWHAKRLRLAVRDAEEETNELLDRYHDAKTKPALEEHVATELQRHTTAILGPMESLVVQQSALLEKYKDELERSSQRLQKYEARNAKAASRKVAQTVAKYTLPAHQQPVFNNYCYDVGALANELFTAYAYDSDFVETIVYELDDYDIEPIVHPDDLEIHEVVDVELLDLEELINTPNEPDVVHSGRYLPCGTPAYTKGPEKKQHAPRNSRSTGRKYINKQKFIPH